MESLKLLEDWQDHTDAKVVYLIEVSSDSIRVTFEDERQICIEYEDGKVRVHAFDTVNEEPTSLDIHATRVEVHV